MTLTLGERSGSMTQVWSVDVGMVSNMQRQNVLGTGSASMTLQGVNLARLSYTSQVRQGRSGCEGTSWESDTSVRCLVGHGIRGTLRLVMTVGERGGSVTQVWSVDMPGVSVVRRVIADAWCSQPQVPGAAPVQRQCSASAAPVQPGK